MIWCFQFYKSLRNIIHWSILCNYFVHWIWSSFQWVESFQSDDKVFRIRWGILSWYKWTEKMAIFWNPTVILTNFQFEQEFKRKFIIWPVSRIKFSRIALLQ
jgi:hypothetical protein